MGGHNGETSDDRISRTPSIGEVVPTPDIGANDGFGIDDAAEIVIDRTIGRGGKFLDLVDAITFGSYTEGQLDANIRELGLIRDQLIFQGEDPADLAELDQAIRELEAVKADLDDYSEYDDAREDMEAIERDGVDAMARTLQDSNTVRVTRPDNPPDPCRTGPYSEMRNVCAAQGKQAHHIVPDYTLRYGTREQGEHGINRIPGMPSLAEGQTICLEGNAATEGTEHYFAHRYTDGPIKDIGQDPENAVQGTAPLAYILEFSKAGVSRVLPECEDEIRRAVDEQFEDIDHDRRVRTTKSRLPHDDALEVLSPYTDDDNWDGD